MTEQPRTEEPKQKCNECGEDAVAEVEIGFGSLKVRNPKCQKHLEEWRKKTEKFREIHEILTGSGGYE